MNDITDIMGATINIMFEMQQGLAFSKANLFFPVLFWSSASEQGFIWMLLKANYLKITQNVH